MGNPKISVAMATYNGERFLQEQLDSIARQTLLPHELVVCDDGSTDGTLKILENFNASAPFEVKIHRNTQRLGYSRNFEKTLSLCTGDVIFLSDQDDVWLPAKIEKVIPNFNARRVTVVTSDMIVADDNLRPCGVSLLQHKLLTKFRDGPLIPGCSTAVRREWRDLVLPIPTDDISHDRWINRLADRLGVRIILPEALQLWRRHGSNASAFSLSHPQKPPFLAGVRMSLRRDPLPLLLKEKDDKNLDRRWLEERKADLALLGLAEAREAALRRLDNDVRIIEKRIEFVKLPRAPRIPAVGRFLMAGGYASFSGWKSALKDIVR